MNQNVPIYDFMFNGCGYRTVREDGRTVHYKDLIIRGVVQSDVAPLRLMEKEWRNAAQQGTMPIPVRNPGS